MAIISEKRGDIDWARFFLGLCVICAIMWALGAASTKRLRHGLADGEVVPNRKIPAPFMSMMLSPQAAEVFGEALHDGGRGVLTWMATTSAQRAIATQL